jgi:hypothetical protein
MLMRVTKLILGMALLAVSFFAVSANRVLAINPQFLVSWSAKNFAPLWYEGKTFPTKGSKISVSFELVSQNSADFGKIINLSGNQVKWYLNDRFYIQQTGLKSITFTNNLFPNSAISVKISAEVINPSDGRSSFVDKYVTIPVSSPRVVISNKNFGRVLSPNSTVNLTATPFFFSVDSVSDISAVWNVGGQQSDKNVEDPFSLAVKFGQNIPPGPITISINAQNISNVLETAANSLGFSIQ